MPVARSASAAKSAVPTSVDGERADDRHAVPVARLEQDRRGIGREPQKPGMAQRHEPGIADDDVEAEREHGVEQDLARDVDEIRIAEPQRQGRERRHGHERGDPSRAHGACLPNSPRGRTASISTIGRNSTK